MAPPSSVKLSIASLFVYSATAFALPQKAQDAVINKQDHNANLVPRYSRIPGGWPGVKAESQSAGAVNHRMPTVDIVEVSRVPSPTPASAGAVSHQTGIDVVVSAVKGSSAAAESARPSPSMLSSIEAPAVTGNPGPSPTPLETIPDPRHSEALSRLSRVLDNIAMFTSSMQSTANGMKNGVQPEATGLAVPFLSEAMAEPKSTSAPSRPGAVPMAISIIDDPVPAHSVQPKPVSVKASVPALSNAGPKATVTSPATSVLAFSAGPAIIIEAPKATSEPLSSARLSTAQPKQSQSPIVPVVASVASLSASLVMSAAGSAQSNIPIIPVIPIVPILPSIAPLSSPARISLVQPTPSTNSAAAGLAPLSASPKSSSMEPLKSEAPKVSNVVPLSVSAQASIVESAEPKPTPDLKPSLSLKSSSQSPIATSDTPRITSQAVVSFKKTSAEVARSSELAKSPLASSSAVFFTIKPANSIAIVPSLSVSDSPKTSAIISEAAKSSVVPPISLKTSISEVVTPTALPTLSASIGSVASSASNAEVSSLSASVAPASTALESTKSDLPKALPTSSSAIALSIKTSAATSSAQPSSTAFIYSIRTATSAPASSSSVLDKPEDKPKSTLSESSNSPIPSSVMKSSAAPNTVTSSSAASSSVAKSSEAKNSSSSRPSSSAIMSSSAAPQTTAKPDFPGLPVGVIVVKAVTYTIAVLSDGNLQFGSGAVVTANAPEMIVDGQTLSFGTNGFVVNHSSTFPVKATNAGPLSATATPASKTSEAAPDQPKASSSKASVTRGGNGLSSPTGGFSQGDGMRLDSSSGKVAIRSSAIALVCGLLAVVHLIKQF